MPLAGSLGQAIAVDHSFPPRHYAGLTTWLQQKTTCPICRDKIGNRDPREGNLPRDAAQAAANANQPGSSGSAAGDAQRLLNEFWAMELAFRLGSLQRCGRCSFFSSISSALLCCSHSQRLPWSVPLAWLAVA